MSMSLLVTAKAASLSLRWLAYKLIVVRFYSSLRMRFSLSLIISWRKERSEDWGESRALVVDLVSFIPVLFHKITYH